MRLGTINRSSLPSSNQFSLPSPDQAVSCHEAEFILVDHNRQARSGIRAHNELVVSGHGEFSVFLRDGISRAEMFTRRQLDDARHPTGDRERLAVFSCELDQGVKARQTPHQDDIAKSRWSPSSEPSLGWVKARMMA